MKLPSHKPSISALFWRILSASLALITPWCMVQIIDRGIGSRDLNALWLWIGIAVSTQIFSGIAAYIGHIRIVSVSRKAERQKLNQLYTHIFHADLRQLSDQAQGTMMRQLLASAAGERSFIATLYNACIPLAISTVGTLALLLTLSWSLALISFIVIPIGGLIGWWLRKKIRHATRRYYQTHENLYQQIVDTFRAILPIRALHQTPAFIAKYESITADYQDCAIDLQKKQAAYTPFFDIIQAISIVFIFGIGGYFAFRGNLTVGILLGFQVYLMRLFGLLKSSTAILTEYQNYLESQSRQERILSLPLSSPPAFKSAAPPLLLDISDLSFHFDTRPVWDHFSLQLHEGEKKAVLLPSGSGKTTLARCILGIYPIDSGTIAIPGADTKNIGFVPQDNVLFDGTIRENIELTSESELSDEAYASLIHICCLEEVSKQYAETSIGSQGSRLSGGEQRRVMLARALANHPKLLIIDQMASELEPDLCHDIFKRIHESCPKLGILYLGHRLPEWD